MLECPSCAEPIAESSRICPGCGTSVESYATRTGTPPRRAGSPSPAPGSPRDTPPDSSARTPAGTRQYRFVSGTLFAGRYRIVGPVGRGGMGEVYRADDLKLGQPVALKFLPKALADDSVRRERFFAEVRIARQIGHPNVCRVYDIGEVDGRHF